MATQDLEFQIKVLVEMALRALSPGINDSFTALAVIDNLSAAVSEIMTRQLPAACHGSSTLPCVKANQVTFAGIFSSACDPIRQNLDSEVLGLIRMIDTIERQIQLLETSAAHTLTNPNDQEQALARVRQTKAAVASATKSAETA